MERSGGERWWRRGSAERWERKRKEGCRKSQHGRAKERGERLREQLRAERAQHWITREKLAARVQTDYWALQRQAVAGEQAREALQRQVAEWQHAVAGQPPNRADLVGAVLGARSGRRSRSRARWVRGRVDRVGGRGAGNRERQPLRGLHSPSWKYGSKNGACRRRGGCPGTADSPIGGTACCSTSGSRWTCGATDGASGEPAGGRPASTRGPVAGRRPPCRRRWLRICSSGRRTG